MKEEYEYESTLLNAKLATSMNYLTETEIDLFRKYLKKNGVKLRISLGREMVF